MPASASIECFRQRFDLPFQRCNDGYGARHIGRRTAHSPSPKNRTGSQSAHELYPRLTGRSPAVSADRGMLCYERSQQDSVLLIFPLEKLTNLTDFLHYAELTYDKDGKQAQYQSFLRRHQYSPLSCKRVSGLQIATSIPRDKSSRPSRKCKMAPEGDHYVTASFPMN